MNWQLSYRADARVVPLADRHYNRQKIGAPQFAPPGRCIVLATPAVDAFWITAFPQAAYVKHDWAGAWVNSAFRREGGEQASTLIREAVAVTRWTWPDVPKMGLVTFVDTSKVAPKRDPGYCYVRAGFRLVGHTREQGLLAFQMLPADMPPAAAPLAGGPGDGKKWGLIAWARPPLTPACHSATLLPHG